MTHRDFTARCEALFGGYGWKAKVSRGLGVNYATVKRWAGGSSPVPPTVVVVVKLLEALREGGRPLPADFA